MDEYGGAADAALEADDAADTADDLGDGTTRMPDLDGSAQQSDR